jgi:hypothetical protein
MDESLNPSESEDPGTRLGHFCRPDEKKTYRGPRRGDVWRCSNSPKKKLEDPSILDTNYIRSVSLPICAALVLFYIAKNLTIFSFTINRRSWIIFTFFFSNQALLFGAMTVMFGWHDHVPLLSSNFVRVASTSLDHANALDSTSSTLTVHWPHPCHASFFVR